EQGTRGVSLHYHPLEKRARRSGHVEIRVQLPAHALQGEEGLDHQCQVSRQGQAVTAQQLGDVAQHQAYAQVLERYAPVLIDELADVLVQARFVDFDTTGPIQQHIRHGLWLLFNQAMQQLRDLEATRFR